MINNIFSIFDPSSYIINSHWAMIVFPLIMLNSNNFNTQPISSAMHTLVASITNELNYSLSSENNSEVHMFLTIFIIVLIFNTTALYPIIPAITAQIAVVLPTALVAWLSIIFIGWLNNTSNALSHLIPQGTPLQLINFIVIIELTSNLIRPITLSIRLAANIIAGHLLINLLSTASIVSNSLQITPIILTSIILTLLETAVAFIQSYVISTLLCLYLSEI